MKRSLTAAAVFSMASAASLLACDPPIGPTETVTNNLAATTATTATNPCGIVPVGITSIEVRFRGEQDVDVEPATSAGFENIGSVAAGTLDNATCTVAPASASVTPVDCGTYDVRVTGDNGMSCEFVANADGTDGNGQACTTIADCPAAHSCVDGACAYRYQGDALYICFVNQEWTLDSHLSATNCGEIFPSM